jgi:hypothetical protein
LDLADNRHLPQQVALDSELRHLAAVLEGLAALELLLRRLEQLRQLVREASLVSSLRLLRVASSGSSSSSHRSNSRPEGYLDSSRVRLLQEAVCYSDNSSRQRRAGCLASSNQPAVQPQLEGCSEEAVSLASRVRQEDLGSGGSSQQEAVSDLGRLRRVRAARRLCLEEQQVAEVCCSVNSSRRQVRRAVCLEDSRQAGCLEDRPRSQVKEVVCLEEADFLVVHRPLQVQLEGVFLVAVLQAVVVVCSEEPLQVEVCLGLLRAAEARCSEAGQHRVVEDCLVAFSEALRPVLARHLCLELQWRHLEEGCLEEGRV